MPYTTDFSFRPGYLYYKGKDLKHYVAGSRKGMTSTILNNIYYSPSHYVLSTLSVGKTSGRIVNGTTTYDACECIGAGKDIDFNGIFPVIDGVESFLKAGYNPHLVMKDGTNSSFIYEATDTSGDTNTPGNDHYITFKISRSDSAITIRKKDSTSTSGDWKLHSQMFSNIFDHNLIPYVFLFYVQAAGGGGGPSYGVSGGGGGGGGGAAIFMYNFNKGDLFIRLGAPGAGGSYSRSNPQGGSGSDSIIYDSSENFRIYIGSGFGASPSPSDNNVIGKGGAGGSVKFYQQVSQPTPHFEVMDLSNFNTTFKDKCFVMCYGNGGDGGSIPIGGSSTIPADGASMTYSDVVLEHTFTQNGGATSSIAIGGGGGASVSSEGVDSPSAVNAPGISAASTDRGNGGSGASAKGWGIPSSDGGSGGRAGFEIWY